MRATSKIVCAATLVAFAALGSVSSLQEAAAGKKNKPHEIEGDWSLLFFEAERTLNPTYFHMYDRWSPTTHAGVRTFSSGKIKQGVPTSDDSRRIWNYYTYTVNSERKPGRIDITYTGRQGENYGIQSKGIYSVKGDWLFLATHAETRPENFAASREDETVYVYRRGILPALTGDDVGACAEFFRLFPPKKAPEKKSKQVETETIDGKWTEFLRDSIGVPVFVPTEKRKSAKPIKLGEEYVKRVWQFSKDMVEKGPDDETFPLGEERWRCKFHPEGKAGTIDAILVDKNGKECPQYQWKAIYEIIDHQMLVCVNSSDPPVRPENFTTSAKTRANTVYLLRRTK